MLHKLLIRAMPLVPNPIMLRFAGRYIAGETQEEALAKLSEMAERGFPGIFDILGEGSGNVDHARAAAESYKQGASAIAQNGLDAYISIKPSHVGLLEDEALALELYSSVLEHCRDLGVLLRVEMEDHPTTDATLRIFESLRESFDAVGIVLQSRLFRTTQDIANLAPGLVDVRIVKGIYLEPAEIAHTNHTAISDAFVQNCRDLLERGDVMLRLATHDRLLGERLIALMREFDVPKDRYEFQVLLGVQEPLWMEWQAAGHPVRVYVPFGPEWRAYSQRRLRKNPDLFKAVLRDMLPV